MTFLTPTFRLVCCVLLSQLLFLATSAQKAPAQALVKSMEVDGQLEPKGGQWVIRAELDPIQGESQPPVFSLEQQTFIHWHEQKGYVRSHVILEALQGDLHQVELTLEGNVGIHAVDISGVKQWWVRQEGGLPSGEATLVLLCDLGERPTRRLEGQIVFEPQDVPMSSEQAWVPPRLKHPSEGFSGGYLAIAGPETVALSADQRVGLTPVPEEELPQWLQSQVAPPQKIQSGFRFFQGNYHLRLFSQLADLDRRKYVVESLSLTGQWQSDAVLFQFKGEVWVRDPNGARVPLLEGDASLVEWADVPHGKWTYVPNRPWVVQKGHTLSSIARDSQTTVTHLARINGLEPDRLQAGQTIQTPDVRAGTGYGMTFQKPGRYPLEFQFLARLDQSDDGWAFSFSTAPSLIRKILIQSMPEKVKVGPASTLYRDGSDESEGNQMVSFHAHQDGLIALELLRDTSFESSKLFYAAQSLEQITLSPGLMRQITRNTIDMMQGEMNELTFEIEGEGEIVSVVCDAMLGWEIEGEANASSRRLVIKLNEPQSASFQIDVESQHALGEFPVSVTPMRFQPRGATRHQGWLRVENSGAVRLQVDQARGFSQVSMNQLMTRPGAAEFYQSQPQQLFAYRYASGVREMKLRAENIYPEVGVSQLLVYQVGLSEVSIEAEMEISVREAPVRELRVDVPEDFALSRVEATGLSDYLIESGAEEGHARLRLLFAQPFIGRKLLQLFLERNEATEAGAWDLPKVQWVGAKTLRGSVAVVAELGLRVRPLEADGLSEMPNGFFPKQLQGLQLAYRLRESAWNARIEIEALDQSVMADVLHLHTIGEGMVYGSSVLNYFVSGAPLSQIVVRMDEEVYNVEFTGPDVRDWTQSEEGYQVNLHRPISGAYTLLASYERPFDARGETISFHGARPVGIQSEQGYLIVTSSDQFRIQPVSVPDTFKSIEPTEVPAEHRLFIHSPMLASYQYSRESTGLTLALEPLAQGKTLELVVDRALIRTRVSSSGEMMTDAQYFIKSQGNAMLPLRLPSKADLWSVTVDGAPVAPIQEEEAYQIPIKTSAQAMGMQSIKLRWAERSERPDRLQLETARLEVPMVLAEWVVETDLDHSLRYDGGNIMPDDLPIETNGWSSLRQVLDVGDTSGNGSRWRFGMCLVMLCVVLGVSRVMAAHRASVSRWRRWTGGLIALAASIMCLTILGEIAGDVTPSTPQAPQNSMAFHAPVVEKSALLKIELEQVLHSGGTLGFGSVVLLLLAAILWMAAWFLSSTLKRTALWSLCWALAGTWLLSLPDGWTHFIGCLGLFFVMHLMIPALWALRRPFSTSLSCWVGTVFFLSLVSQTQAQSRVDRLDQKVVVKGNTAQVEATFRWQSDRAASFFWGDLQPTVTSYEWLEGKGRFIRSAEGPWSFMVDHPGSYGLRIHYLVELEEASEGERLTLPAAEALIHHIALKVIQRDVAIESMEAVSVREQETEQNLTQTDLVMRPAREVTLRMHPRMRNTSQEEALYFTQWNHLFLPTAGLVEGFHQLRVRMAQGQLQSLHVNIPASWTIADVWGDVGQGWRFDPEASRLFVPVKSVSGQDLEVRLHSQLSVPPLPMKQEVQLPGVPEAAREVGMVGVAALMDVQLDQVETRGFSSIQLEDFDPIMIASASQAAQEQPVLKRAFRYGEGDASLKISASTVTPDLRALTQQTLSLAENRSILSVNAQITITRAGIFQMRFPLSEGMDVESLSGASVSHWTESAVQDVRWVTVHLKDKTLGKMSLDMTLSGPGPSPGSTWVVPSVRFESASRQEGQLTVSSEQGMRLQAAQKEGVVQLDPETLGMGDRDAMVFRLLHQDWNLALEVAQLEAWVQVDGFQSFQMSDARVEVETRLDYQIKNAGVRSLNLQLPKVAEGVRILGEYVSDFDRPSPDSGSNRDVWMVSLDRRVIGNYALRVVYSIPMESDMERISLLGDLAQGVRLQRGYVSIAFAGRLQVSVDDLPRELQPVDWQSIPREWRQEATAVTSRLSYRLIQPAFELPLSLLRREIARLLPAQIRSARLRSVAADAGAILTEVTMEIDPGDKRLLPVELNPSAVFWYALVNGRSVWPWQDEEGRILIPLESAANPGESTRLEFLYASSHSQTNRRVLKLELSAPKFDLPLENVTWQVLMDEKWELEDHAGSLQLAGTDQQAMPLKMDWDRYFESQRQEQAAQSRDAQRMLQLGNQLLVEGDSRFAQKAFEQAYSLSKNDAAFNEDARVQLRNLKTQQAFLGLNARNGFLENQLSNALEAKGDSAKDGLRFSRENVDRFANDNSDDVNVAFNLQAERIIQQQEAASETAERLRASFPEIGHTYTFEQSLQFEDWSSLELSVEARLSHLTVGWGMRMGFVFLSLVALWAGLLMTSALTRYGR